MTRNGGPTLTNFLLIVVIRLPTVRNLRLLVIPLTKEPFANEIPIVVQPLAAQNSAQIHFKLEESVYRPFPNSFQKLPTVGQQSMLLGIDAR